MTKSLLLKGLAGVAAIGGAATGGFVAFNKGLFGGKAAVPQEPKSENVSDLTDKDLIDKAGLNCQLGESDTEVKDSKECSVKEGSTLRIMVGTQEEDGITFNTTSSDSAKLKVSRSEEVGGDGTTEKYNKKLKFVVDSGDISLTKGSGTPTHFQKLEQFETYEIFLKDKDKFYLRRKTDAKEEKIKALELPTGKGKCSLPESGDSSCTLTIEEAKKIKFENQSQGVTVTGNSVTLKISKVEDTTSFPDGYRFTFTFPGDVTINSKQLKAKIPYEFKIKKGTGNTLTLEQAWSDENTFTKKAGLDCSSDNTQCSVSTTATDSKLNVKVGTQKKEGITSLNGGTGKIKMEKDKEGYRQGLKFTITTADVSLTGGTGGDAITKLEELETYEITEEGGKYYLTRKTTKEENIRSSLVLPKDCELPTTNESKTCSLSQENFKKINFDGKSGESFEGQSMSLTISKADSTDFPLGYRFTFKTETEATIKTDTKIKANIPTDFKIKKDTTTPTTLTLEKAWSDTDYSFAKKVGLTCTAGNGECCSQTSGVNINVKRGNDTKTGITSVTTTGTAKIKVEKDKEGYNQGLKFTITGGDVSLTGGSGGSFEKLEELETYEITEEGGKYYLTRKDEASKTIESQLGLPSSCKLGSSSSCTLTVDQLKNINFEGKDTSSGITMTSGTATLTITKATNTTDFPLGYKFSLQSQQDITIKSNTNTVKKNTPYDFKIKRPTNGGNISLEKAWSDFSFAEKAGLNCTNSQGSGDTCCSKSGSSNINVKKGSDKKDGITGINGSNSGKIKVEKDQEGYNQGLKFTIDGGDVSLTGGNKAAGSTNDITKLEEYETYEIKEEGGKYYLTRKEESIVFIKKQLGFEFCPKNEWKITGSGTSASITFLCDIENLDNLKKIKINNKSGHESKWPTGNIKVQLEIKKSNSGGSGDLAVEINESESSDTQVCIPDGNGGSVDIKQTGVNAKYKIKKDNSGGSWCLVKDGNGSSSGQCSVSK